MRHRKKSGTNAPVKFSRNLLTESLRKIIFSARMSKIIFDLHSEDDRIVHRATVTDLETHEKFMDSYNFTVVELAKVPFFIESKSDSLSKWLFFFRYLNKLKALPPEMNEKKFRQLTESSKVSKFSKEEFEAYQKVFHEKWDHNVLRRSFFEEFADDVNAKMDERSREIAKRLIANGKLSDEDIAKCSGLSIEDVVVLRSQAET